MSHPTTDRQNVLTDLSPLHDAAIALSLVSSEAGHEVVQTLNVLRFLTKSKSGSEAIPEAMLFAVSEIERLERLLGHLRQFKLPVLVWRKLALSECTASVLSPLREACIEKAVILSLGVSEGLFVHGDPTYLSKVLHWLVTHALDNAPTGSVLTIRAAPVASVLDESVLLEVVDRGPPLPESSPAALFDVWNILNPEGQAARRAFAHRLLRSLGSTLIYEYVGGCNVFRFSLSLAQGKD